MSNAWTDKVVLITGGSQGLGWQLAKAFLDQQSRVILVARNPSGLQQAADRLRAECGKNTEPRDGRPSLVTYPADILRQSDVDRAIEHIQAEFGRLDVLVNCAGKSSRGLASETSVEQFRDLWELNFEAVVRCTQAALSLLIESQGQLINIGSLASRSPGRYLGAYPASKYALAAYTHQLRLELKNRVRVLLVCPGPMRRDDAGKRYAEQVTGLPPEAAAPGGGAKLKGLDTPQLAQKILTAAAAGRAELVVPSKARWLFAISQLWPRFGDWVLSKFTGSSSS
jgi:NAD(P)-dependent dehydrogenase (short-subunit alcohol dehydrogenase family)